MPSWSSSTCTGRISRSRISPRPSPNSVAANVVSAPVLASSARWHDLGLRALSAAILAPLALACLWFGGWPWILLVAVATIGLAHEWFTLTKSGPAARLLPFGPLAILPTTCALLWLRADPAAGRTNLLFLLLVVWTTDIGAYLFGRLIGGEKLAPSISPGKTRSGALGGLACAVLLGAIGGPRAAATAGVLSLAAQAGDLAESALKRRAGVKDSGRLIPGHGGLLDRLDGLLAAAPLAWLLAALLGRGVELWP